MLTIVSILTFISRINASSECFNQNKSFVFHYFRFHEQLKFHAQSRWAWKKRLTLFCRSLGQENYEIYSRWINYIRSYWQNNRLPLIFCCFLVPSTHRSYNLCKQFGPRSGPTFILEVFPSTSFSMNSSHKHVQPFDHLNNGLGRF